VFRDNRLIHGLDDLSGIEFEKLCAKVLNRRGYNNIYFTPATNDYGIDIIADSMNLKFVIQCKRSKTSIGNKAVQEALSGKIYYNCDVAVVVTNRYFGILQNKQFKQPEQQTLFFGTEIFFFV